jgi:hypothetical protein
MIENLNFWAPEDKEPNFGEINVTRDYPSRQTSENSLSASFTSLEDLSAWMNQERDCSYELRMGVEKPLTIKYDANNGKPLLRFKYHGKAGQSRPPLKYLKQLEDPDDSLRMIWHIKQKEEALFSSVSASFGPEEEDAELIIDIKEGGHDFSQLKEELIGTYNKLDVLCEETVDCLPFTYHLN